MENTDGEHLTTKSMQLSSVMMHCVQLKIVTIKEDPTSTTGTMGRQSWGWSTLGNHETQQARVVTVVTLVTVVTSYN